MAKIKRSPTTQKIADLILSEYDPKTSSDVHEAIKDVFGQLFEKLLNAEMTAHLGYNKSSQDDKETSNRRNGYGKKTIQGSFGEIEIATPRDREGTFEPAIVPKHQKDVSEIEQKVLSLYAKGMSQRDISNVINDIYGFSLSKEKISSITDTIKEDVKQWLERPLKELYTFVFVDCIYVKIKNHQNNTVSNNAVYVILGIDSNGLKEVLGLHIAQTESKSVWMNIFDSIKARGVKDILFLSMDGVSGLEEGVKAIYPDTVVQRCIVHLIRNSTRYIPSKDMKEFCKDCKAMYGASNLQAAEDAFLYLCEKWEKYPAAVKVWERNFEHVRQLYSYPQDIRKVMYTTNAIESVNSSLRKVTKKGMFEDNMSVLKVFYLRITGELSKKWNNNKISNWSRVLNQLLCLEGMEDRIEKYLK